MPKLYSVPCLFHTICPFTKTYTYNITLNAAYASSNKRDATLQILQYHTRKRCLKLHELRLRFLARKGYYNMETLEVLGLFSSQGKPYYNHHDLYYIYKI